jgi:hypothetical protein
MSVNPDDLRELLRDIQRRCTSIIRKSAMKCNSISRDPAQAFLGAAQRMGDAYADCAILWDHAVAEMHRMGVAVTKGDQQTSSTPGWLLTSTIILLDAVDRGGVPAFISANLRHLAMAWGIVLTDQLTPDQVVHEIRKRAGIAG